MALTATGCGFGTWLGAADDIREDFWLTDRGYKYPGPWRNGQPDGEKEQNCMMIGSFVESSLGVSDINCDFPGTGALCEYIPDGSRFNEMEVTPMPQMVPTTANPCDDDWTHFDGYCYKAVEEEDLAWFGATSVCSSLGAYPATLESLEEKVAIVEQYQNKRSLKSFSALEIHRCSERDQFK